MGKGDFVGPSGVVRALQLPDLRKADPMMTQGHETAQVGELVEAVFDEAAQFSTDPAEVARLASAAVMRMLLRGRSHEVMKDVGPGK